MIIGVGEWNWDVGAENKSETSIGRGEHRLLEGERSHSFDSVMDQWRLGMGEGVGGRRL